MTSIVVRMLANADGHSFAVLDSGLLQSFLAERLHDKSIIGVFTYRFDRALILINGDDFFPCICQSFYQGGAKAP